MQDINTGTHARPKIIAKLLSTMVFGKHHSTAVFRGTAFTVLAGLSLAGSLDAYAAEKDSKEIRDKIIQLEQALEDAKRELKDQTGEESASSAEATAKTETAKKAEPEDQNLLGSVVVTSRNRAEIAQDVPIPETIISGKQIDRDRIFTIDDLTRVTPGLTATTPNARRSGISIRGIGKSTGNENQEAAVGIVVDDIYLSQVGMSFQNFTDLDRVEVLRGPQGTLKGKNTTLGVINYVSRAPSFTQQGWLELEAGGRMGEDASPGGQKARGSYSNAIVDDLLAWRGSFIVDKQDGDRENVFTEGGRWHEKNRLGGRIQFLLTPTENITAKLNLDSAVANERSNTKAKIIDPQGGHTSRLSRQYFDNGNYRPIIGIDNADKVELNSAQPLQTYNRGASATVDWNLGPVTLSSITGTRKYHFDARNDAEETKFDIQRGGTLVDAKQFSQEFRLTSEPGGLLDYQTGLYYLKAEADTTSRNLYGEDAGAYFASTGNFNTLFADAAGRELLKNSLNNVYATNNQISKTDSKALFGQINWHLTDKTDLTTGLRFTHEKRSNSISKSNTFYDGSDLTALTNANGASAAQVTAANTIRNGQTGNSYGYRDGDLTENSISWLLSPSYKYNENVMFYASAAGGEKSSVVAFRTTNGERQDAKPEKSLDFELGFKSVLFDRRLLLNVNFYNTVVKDYQATTSTFVGTTGPNATTTGYRSDFGNIPEITARGVELDGAFSATSNLIFNFGAAYNHAVYTDWKEATCPTENTAPICDNTGKQIVGAPRLTGIIGADYRLPLAYGFTGHAFFSTVFRSKQNLESQLSEYGEVSGYSVTDGGIGIITNTKNKFEINLVAKNLFDKRYTTSVNNFTNNYPVGWDGLGTFRYIGLVLKGTL
ncbi:MULTISPECIES: TonB-dependent receptor [unclassified Methylophilus]|uniref:TonB-dependent receptor n=1 Tax=unclassified Methylophilus TaxID=2630143 RepID=UPI000B058607|nr:MULTISPECIES: TonB-dependent receptor [unclassified Methylophilus]